jgi:N-acetylglucosaminyldiphosphoundecaprenol N-acetyl-beta-D-mannosaminyltransferase
LPKPVELSFHDSLFVLGVRVDAVTFDQTLTQIESFIGEGRPHQIVTVNPEFIMAAQSDAEFRHIINDSALALPDGVGVWLASRFLGRPLPERIPGVDLVQKLAALSADRGYRLFFLGAMPGVADKAVEALRACYPGLALAGTYVGSPRLEDEAAIREQVRATRPQVLFVAYGAPAQDHWIARNLERLGVPVCIGVGGSFDFIAGVRPRAPGWIRSLGLEWLHRLVTQPWRWRRMLALPRFAWQVLWYRRALAQSPVVRYDND